MSNTPKITCRRRIATRKTRKETNKWRETNAAMHCIKITETSKTLPATLITTKF